MTDVWLAQKIVMLQAIMDDVRLPTPDERHTSDHQT